MTTRKIALVGGAPGWQEAPFDNDEWEIWVLGNQMDNYKDKRVNRIFQIHDELGHFDPKYPDWVSSLKIPMVVGEHWPVKADHIEVFDYEAALPLIGENFSSSISVMMAQAVMDGADEISIYGVNMDVDKNEYYYQRPSMEQWIGYAKGKGITVNIPKRSPLGRSTLRECNMVSDDSAMRPFTEKQFLVMATQHRNAITGIERKIQGYKLNMAAHHATAETYERLASVSRSIATGHEINNLADGLVLNVKD